MKKAINFLCWTFVSFTIISLVLTLLTTYQFVYVKYFDSYYTLQLSIIITMIMWSVRLFSFNKKLRNIVYPLLCVIIAVGAIFFMYMKVF
ncbi:hypothetical protein CLOACE_11390 [Clostridium acetireducens DSM 10703]|jgi:hypothetical protein|uniref:Uncharacterized protein n=1 Tax=Clostridium acetireducens DSM 10703 TaxID=1121290 RepID=A0A1E8EZ10_9CLOT|nr:hypothetical protein [Clostridium acetireducens]OFI06240.1 hypothetical protein CLOACE_11390 [Clostridium acetireducens DSM 10703]